MPRMTFEPPAEFNIADHFLDARVREGKGDKVAILFEDRKLTYRDVQRMANRFANALRMNGAEIENRIIIALPDSPEWVGAFFGILKLGGVVVMVNPHLKPDELEYFFEYTRARIAIVHAEVLPTFEAVARTARYLKHLFVVGQAHDVYPSWESLMERVSDEFENARTHKDDPAIWLFSGGTTGRPKAVVQTHTSFANTTACYAHQVIQYRDTDITMAVPKLYFGYATGSNLLFPFSVGAATALFRERSTAEVLFEKISKFRPTILINVPTMINHMINDAGQPDLSSLRLSTSAGEALPVELYNKWKKRFGVEVLDGLGTAEMWHIFISNRLGDVKPGSLGKVVPGFEIKVCDDDGREVPAGEIGMLWVRGNSRAIAYWQQMEKTMRGFRGEWYVTGDLVRRDAEGYFWYCGRADDTMKVSGKWVSPGEVENCLLKHPAVKECAVVGYVDKDGLTKPKAFIILNDGQKPSPALEDELKTFVKNTIEPHKYPRTIVFMDAFPRTHLGKVDRGKLKSM